MMRIEVNGAARTVTATTLADLLAELGMADARVATAVNGSFVPATLRQSRAIVAGDRVEILSPMQGG